MTEYGKKHTDGSRSGGQEPWAIWTPKFDGDAPPNVTNDMLVRVRPNGAWREASDFCWLLSLDYDVPSEAIFDYPKWAAQGRANADKLPSDVAEALGPERDWAAEVARLEEQVRIYRGAQLNAEEKLSREQDNAKGWKLRAERLEEALAKAEAAQ